MLAARVQQLSGLVIKMDHLKVAQSLVDDVKETMPEGVYMDVMRELRDAYETFGVVYQISYVEISAERKNELEWAHKTMLVQEVELSSRPHWYWGAVFDTGTMPPLSSWQSTALFNNKIAHVRNMVCVVKKVEQIMTNKKRKNEEAE